MAIKFYDQFSGKNSFSDLTKLENYVGYSLPESYKTFLSKHNGGRVKPNTFETTNKEIETSIQFLYGITEKRIYDLQTNYGEWQRKDRPKSYLPIGVDNFGNSIILDLSHGHILFWSHDTPELRLIEISKDFDGFLKNLHEIAFEQSDLDVAIATQDVKYFERRLASGEHIDSIKNEFGQTSVVMASLRNKINLLKFFKQNGSKMENALFSASSNGHYNAVKYLLSLGLDPNERDVEQNNDTALIQAALGGNIDIVKALIKAGADVNAKDKHGQSVLRKAYWSDNQELIDYLESLGAQA